MTTGEIMKRREFIKSGAIAGAAALGLSQAHGMVQGAAGIGQRIPTIALFDERFPEAQQFGRALAATGAEVMAATADTGSLWYGTLRARLAAHHGPLQFAGLTTYADFHVLESCAREFGLITVHEALHDQRPGQLVHTVRQGYSTALERALSSSAGDWALSLAASLASRQQAPGVAGVHVIDSRIAATGRRGTLVSWALRKV
jgi:hypothetical protein